MSAKKGHRRYQGQTQERSPSSLLADAKTNGAQLDCKGKIQTTKLIKPLNANQRLYLDSIKHNVVTLAAGAAGTGKTVLALHTGIALLNSDTSPIERIFYLRSNVGMVEEKGLGFLPGELSAKIMSLAYPVLDNLINFMSEAQAKYLIEKGKIEVLPIAMVRGRSFANAFIIADEVQSTTPHMFKTILTRISEGSKLVMIGDTKQCDLKADLAQANGLVDALTRLRGLPNVGIVEFGLEDIVRHSIIPMILKRYE